MIIRKSTINDIPEILKIYDFARSYMAKNGNPTQWINGYPGYDAVKNDIDNDNSYVIINNDAIVGTFAFIIGEDPTYKIIENGSWRFNETYGTIHRIASNGSVKGIARLCFDFCLSKINYLRIDTHENNKTMIHSIEKYGFFKCGIIYVRNHEERLAYDFLENKIDC